LNQAIRAHAVSDRSDRYRRRRRAGLGHITADGDDADLPGTVGPILLEGRAMLTGEMTRHTTFKFCLDPTVEQFEVLARHAGASRFAFNQCLRIVKSTLTQRAGAVDGV
jgi:Helix-turn-helix domain